LMPNLCWSLHSMQFNQFDLRIRDGLGRQPELLHLGLVCSLAAGIRRHIASLPCPVGTFNSPLRRQERVRPARGAGVFSFKPGHEVTLRIAEHPYPYPTDAFPIRMSLQAPPRSTRLVQKLSISATWLRRCRHRIAQPHLYPLATRERTSASCSTPALCRRFDWPSKGRARLGDKEQPKSPAQFGRRRLPKHGRCNSQA
jgi:hypothetical protein